MRERKRKWGGGGEKENEQTLPLNLSSVKRADARSQVLKSSKEVLGRRGQVGKDGCDRMYFAKIATLIFPWESPHNVMLR